MTASALSDKAFVRTRAGTTVTNSGTIIGTYGFGGGVVIDAGAGTANTLKLLGAAVISRILARRIEPVIAARREPIAL
jgi:hypothetical protein